MTLKHSKQAKNIVLTQIEVISSLLGKKVQLDLFGDWLLELNYYPDEDTQCSVIQANLSTEEEELIFELQNVIDVMYLMKYGKECPNDLYYPNKYDQYRRTHRKECDERKRNYDERLKQFNEEMLRDEEKVL